MARRNRNLGGLAALGALGMAMARLGKKTPEEAAATPVEDRGTARQPVAAQVAAAQAAAADDGNYGLEGRRQGPIASLPGRPAAAAPAREDTTSLARETARAGRGPIASMGYQNPQRGPASSNIGEMRAINAARENVTDMAREAARGGRGRIAAVGYQNPQRGPTAEEFFEYRRGQATDGMKKGGTVKMASGGSVNSASKRGDGIAQRGKTRGRII